MKSNSKPSIPGSVRRETANEVTQATENTTLLELETAKTIDSDNFRVAAANPETGSRSRRLREAVQRAGGNKAVSAKSGVPVSTLGVYLAGGEWKVSPTVAIAEACGVSLDWLITGHEAAPAGEPSLLTHGSSHFVAIEAKNYAIIPRYDVRASAGSGKLVEQDDANNSYIALERAFIRQVLHRRHQDMVSITATGDSMEPTIHDGDLLFIDTSMQEIENSRIYVLDIDGALLVKRLSIRLDGSITVRSDNPKYEAETVTPSERNKLRVIGQVVYQAGPPRS